MSLDNWIESIINDFEQNNIITLETEYDIDIPVPIVCLKNDEENINKLMRLLQMHNLPLLTFRKKFSDDVEPLSLDQLDEDEHYIYPSNDKIIDYINKKVNQHNQKLKSVPVNETVKASIFAVLPSLVISIENHHVNFSEWRELVYTGIEDIINELDHDVYYLELKTEYKEEMERERLLKREKLNALIRDWSAFLFNDETFRLCSNQKLRREFLLNNFEPFISKHKWADEQSDDELVLSRQNLYSQMSNEIDLVWNKLKAGR
ncbi:hypothetical protein ACQCN2_13355 [Brevibacillus ginsengisoli]|uniref:hypothetical protein n=1 Tax=Brevibacillus ginsengisoli TaxID=363854 RepID=UPI003CE72F0D